MKTQDTSLIHVQRDQMSRVLAGVKNSNLYNIQYMEKNTMPDSL